MRSRIYEFVLAAMFAVVIAICAWITIPFVVPFTLQTFGVFLCIAVLGGKLASLSVFIYILLGMIGLPVFAGFQGGVGVFFGSTGGYVLGFLAAALLIWWMESIFGRSRWQLPLWLFAGLLVCYGFGTCWYVFLCFGEWNVSNFMTVLSVCVFPFVVFDILKLLLALTVHKKMRKALGGIWMQKNR